MTTDFIAELASRGLFQQSTAPDVADVLLRGPAVGYCGFDPTAASLHVGSLLPVLGLVRLQRAGHRPIALVGGGTGMIGDPSGKSAERTMLGDDALAANLAGLRAQLGRFLDFEGPRGATLVDNGEWLRKVGLIDFLRDVGKHFSVNQMVNRDSVRLRLEGREQGISYTEFSYALLQAYDYLVLHDRFGCTLQIGGSDQWGNIVDGTDLVRRLRGATVYGVTMPLVTRADGKKFGKSEQGNVWLDAALTRPFEFHQFWLNVDDADAVRYLRFFTFLGTEEIAELEAAHAAAPEKRVAHRRLADEVTAFVHGVEAVRRSNRAAAVLFEGGALDGMDAAELADAFAGAPRHRMAKAALGTPEAQLVATLVAAGLFTSKGQARQAVETGSISVNQGVVREVGRTLGDEDLLPGVVRRAASREEDVPRRRIRLKFRPPAERKAGRPRITALSSEARLCPVRFASGARNRSTCREPIPRPTASNASRPRNAPSRPVREARAAGSLRSCSSRASSCSLRTSRWRKTSARNPRSPHRPLPPDRAEPPHPSERTPEVRAHRGLPAAPLVVAAPGPR
jgi:tyrosyl-tRNA synthetase